jgi:hypothetical protein
MARTNLLQSYLVAMLPVNKGEKGASQCEWKLSPRNTSNQQSAVMKPNSPKCCGTATYIWWNEQDSRCVSIEQSKKKKQTNSNRNMTPNGSSPSRPQVFKKVNGDQSRTLEEKMTHHVGISRLRYRDHGPAPHWTAHKGWATDRPTASVPTLSHVWHIGLLHLFWT